MNFSVVFFLFFLLSNFSILRLKGAELSNAGASNGESKEKQLINDLHLPKLNYKRKLSVYLESNELNESSGDSSDSNELQVNKILKDTAAEVMASSLITKEDHEQNMYNEMAQFEKCVGELHYCSIKESRGRKYCKLYLSEVTRLISENINRRFSRMQSTIHDITSLFTPDDYADLKLVENEFNKCVKMTQMTISDVRQFYNLGTEEVNHAQFMPILQWLFEFAQSLININEDYKMFNGIKKIIEAKQKYPDAKRSYFNQLHDIFIAVRNKKHALNWKADELRDTIINNIRELLANDVIKRPADIFILFYKGRMIYLQRELSIENFCVYFTDQCNTLKKMKHLVKTDIFFISKRYDEEIDRILSKYITDKYERKKYLTELIDNNINTVRTRSFIFILNKLYLVIKMSYVVNRLYKIVKLLIRSYLAHKNPRYMYAREMLSVDIPNEFERAIHGYYDIAIEASDDLHIFMFNCYGVNVTDFLERVLSDVSEILRDFQNDLMVESEQLAKIFRSIDEIKEAVSAELYNMKNDSDDEDTSSDEIQASEISETGDNIFIYDANNHGNEEDEQQQFQIQVQHPQERRAKHFEQYMIDKNYFLSEGGHTKLMDMLQAVYLLMTPYNYESIRDIDNFSKYIEQFRKLFENDD